MYNHTDNVCELERRLIHPMEKLNSPFLIRNYSVERNRDL